MGSRCGDMDPAVVLFMMQKGSLSTAEADVLMNKKSGFLGMCGHADVRAVLQAADSGDQKAETAVKVCVSTVAPTLLHNDLAGQECTLVEDSRHLWCKLLCKDRHFHCIRIYVKARQEQ